MVEPQLAARSLQFETSVTAELMVHADREKTEQIVLNMLSNATKFTPSGGSVTLRATAAPDRADAVNIAVIDSGVGIPASKLERIFEPFVQVESSHASRVEGTGLGLSISRELARGMGGELIAESTPGEGSTFTLRLRRGSAA